MEVEQRLRERLVGAFNVQHMELENESHQHSVRAHSETHFRLVLVSDAFDGLRPVARHQRVYGLLAEELAGPVHALALHLYTPGEWSERSAAPTSPACLGGSAAEGKAGGAGGNSA